MPRRPRAISRLLPGLALAALACQAGARAQPPATPPPRPEPAATTILPGPARASARPHAPADNRGCETCHQTIAGEWRDSLHHNAYADPEFARALAREPQPFCRGCHAPEADPRAPPPPELAALGVGCVTCHAPAGLPPGAVLAVPGDSLPAPHPVIASTAFAGAPACAACHEFTFPGRPAPMQLTVREHAASRFAATSCADCHMPWTGEGAARHRSHVFAASRDPALLQRSLHVEATRRPGTVVLRIIPAAVGHAVPTGDLFRRLLVEAEANDEADDPVSYDARPLARHFERQRLSSLRTLQVEVADDRPGAPDNHEPDGATVVLLDLGPEADAYPVRWRVIHQRVEFHRADDVVIAGEQTIASGDLPPL